MQDLNIKQIKWDGDDPKSVMTSYTKIFNSINIGFRIMNGVNGIILVDFTSEKRYPIDTVDEGKKLAQKLFENYINEIILNVIE